MTLRKNKVLAFLFIFSCSVTPAQSKDGKSQIKKYLNEAQVHFYNDDYYRAWVEYIKVLKINKQQEVAGVNGAICAIKLNYPVDSLNLLVSSLSASNLTDALYYLARVRHQQRKFAEALELLNDYNRTQLKERTVENEEVEYWITVCKNAEDLIAEPHHAVIKNMGAEINSSSPDYVPVILPDESSLYFTSRREGSSDNKKDNTGGFYEDVYVSYKQDGHWKKAVNAGPPVNSETNDACVAISPDGQRMIVYRTSITELGGNLFITKMGANNKWGSLEKIGHEVNSQYIETSACFSNDTSEIYFSSNRPGGYGGKDIYRIKKAPNGSWAMPYNLGPNVNTPYDEHAPFLHPDGLTLYFSSEGHNTMGLFDVFKSVQTLEEGQFSMAENLGYPINDVGNDIFFVLSVDGQTGYYSSTKKETFGGLDIYEIDTRFGDNDLEIKYGTAWVDDAPGRVKITLTDTESNQVSGNYYSNPGTGKFILVMNPLKSYKALVETEGYDPLEVQIVPLASEKTSKELEFKFAKK